VLPKERQQSMVETAVSTKPTHTIIEPTAQYLKLGPCLSRVRTHYIYASATCYRAQWELSVQKKKTTRELLISQLTAGNAIHTKTFEYVNGHQRKVGRYLLHVYAVNIQAPLFTVTSCSQGQRHVSICDRLIGTCALTLLTMFACNNMIRRQWFHDEWTSNHAFT
jgi:hypothetical protein